MNERSKRRRKRNQTINIQITLLSWALELIAGGLMLIDYFFSLHDNEFWKSLYLVIDLLLCCVIIPGSYTINTEAIKEIIINEGWRKHVRDLFRFSKARVVPSQQIKMPAKERQIYNTANGSIPTISGKLYATTKC